MSILNKSDLYYEKKYSWVAITGDDPNKRSVDSNFFHRKEGYEVLDMIDDIADELNLTSKGSAIKIERILFEDLPGTVRSREKVLAWVVENWSIYSPCY